MINQFSLPPGALSLTESVEAALDAHWPGEWRRLRADELEKLRKQFTIANAWRLDMPRVDHYHPRVDHIFLFYDDVFPLSDLHICAPQADGRLDKRWPHVEASGLFCLARQPLDNSLMSRVLLAVSDAATVLSMNQQNRKEEFQREFLSYWQREAAPVTPWRVLFRPVGSSREIFYSSYRGSYIFGQSEEQVVSWLKHSGVINPQKPLTAWFSAIDEALEPAEYPIKGRDLLNLVGTERIMPLLDPPKDIPVLLGIPTENGSVFAGVLVCCPSQKAMWKGFRVNKPLPERHIESCYANCTVKRIMVQRVDHAWVHGRDHDSASVQLSGKAIALIGCGALGGELVRLLAQAGVGRFYLVDGDSITPENTSRHLLGSSEVGSNKAAAIAQRLGKDFPHINGIHPFGCRFEDLSAEQLAEINGADLLITAGLFLSTDIRVNKYRIAANIKSPWLVSWTEELASAGHAVLLTGDVDLMDLFNEAGKPKKAMTSLWPTSVGTIAEAGCGNYFQPYGAVDMLGTIGLAARLAIDSLLGRCVTPVYRIWLGDRDRAAELGATLSAEFNTSMTERAISWPIQ